MKRQQRRKSTRVGGHDSFVFISLTLVLILVFQDVVDAFSWEIRNRNGRKICTTCLSDSGRRHGDPVNESGFNRRKLFPKVAAIATFSSGTLIWTSENAAAVVQGGSLSRTPSPSDDGASSSTLKRTTTTVSTPLEFIPSLGAYVVKFTLFGERFGAIVDTGSPFLTVPSTCNKWAYKYRWGCYRPERTMDSGFANTVEGFDNNSGTVVWRKALFSFDSNSGYDGDITNSQNLVFGVLDASLMDGPGGVFLGLIKETDKWIRPSFLGQTGYQSFCVDLRRNPKLVLSKEPMIGSMINESNDYIPLVKDLNRRYKDPVVHYTTKAKSFVVNGLPLRIGENRKELTYVIFDTGVTGMVISQELFDGRYLQARKNREKSLWGEVRVTFLTKAGKDVTLSATKPVTTPLGKATPWGRFKGNLIVLGLAFLDGLAMTIDTDTGKLQLSE